jgi:hypothetical protein
MMTRDALVLIQSAVVRAACEQRTEQDLAALRASVEQAAGVPPGDGWERRAAAHVEFHNLLADATGNPVLAILVRSMTDTLRDIVVAVGPTADEAIVGSRGRLLRHLQDRDAESAAGEMEEHLSRLDDMRLTDGGAAGAAAGAAGAATVPEAGTLPGGGARTGARPRRRRKSRKRMDSVLLSRQLTDLPRVAPADYSFPRRVG